MQNNKDIILEKISELNEIYSETNSLFKKIESFSDELKNDLLKEYHYVCTNLMACISCMHNNDLDKAKTYYNQTYQCIKILYNDCVDVVIDIVYKKLKYLAKFSSIYSIGVSQFYSEYTSTNSALNNIRSLISESRKYNDEWEVRKEIYKDIISSDDFSKLIEFLSNYENIVDNMRIFVSSYEKQEKDRAKKEKRELGIFIVSILSLIVMILSFIKSFFT